ncbi:hypothetical protein CP973_12515 [Streptomyces albofaciens JCM 4342]|uniref:hypothetical protein n=1 Tax=Streptomyces albofaciens TaxID=66866 RepID=UPI000A844DBD|nr:hypothetical protein [Streptomyces albofaciens]KAA6222644.1 hypothetical protein CP973_12515 [Streptomyces albofaciens JCM 4342]
MDAFGGEGLAAHGFDPDETVWVRGVDYVTGWRQAREVGAAPMEALAEAKIDVMSLKALAGCVAAGQGEATRAIAPGSSTPKVITLRRGVT